MILVQLDMVQEENESLLEKVMPTTFLVFLVWQLLAGSYRTIVSQVQQEQFIPVMEHSSFIKGPIN